MSRPAQGAAWPTATTRLVALLGWPARHSLSPQMHNAAFAEHALDVVYLALPTPPEALAGVVEALGVSGALGANVTVPHKQHVVAACDHLTDEARLIGAVNTLSWTVDGLLGDNTDAAGLRDALTADVAVAAGDRFVLLGTGGAARAAAVAIGRLQGRVTVAGRRRGAADGLAELATAAGASEVGVVDVTETAALASAVSAARVVMNATPLGMAGERLPEPFHRLAAGQVAYDLVYEPSQTPFLTDAAAAGAGAHHGLGMLVGQAGASYAVWTGQPAPLATMSAVATAALVERSRHR